MKTLRCLLLLSLLVALLPSLTSAQAALSLSLATEIISTASPLQFTTGEYVVDYQPTQVPLAALDQAQYVEFGNTGGVSSVTKVVSLTFSSLPQEEIELRAALEALELARQQGPEAVAALLDTLRGPALDAALHRNLLHLPRELVDYILCHELLNRKVSNHNKSWDLLMRMQLLGWRQRERRLAAPPLNWGNME